MAKKWKMNVVLPLHEVREAGGGGGGAAKKMYNTAVVINRAGETVGMYTRIVWLTPLANQGGVHIADA